MRRVIKDWDEQDVHTGWRKFYCWTQRAGATAKVKRRTNRRERREGRADVRARLMERLDDGGVQLRRSDIGS